MKWEIDFRIFDIRLRAFFQDTKMTELWNSIKKERDALDVKLYYLLASKDQGSPEDCYSLIEKISNMTVKLSKRMLVEITLMKVRPFESTGEAT